MEIKDLLVAELIFIFAQLLLFIPFFYIWRSDCKSIGKENLAVPLKTRFVYWCIFFPIWAIPLISR